MIHYEEVLNESQLNAVMTDQGPLLVIAGAGSGKTRTLVYRVARLVETGVPPESILLLTFTRKAAGEMLERAAGLSNERCRHVSGGTFHSLAYRVLREHAGLLGFERTFTILDRSDMEEVIQSAVQEMQIGKGAIRFPKRSTLANILSKAANLQSRVEDLMEEEYGQFLEHIPQIERLNRLYREHKRENQLMDYDDLILFFRQLLSENVEMRSRLSEQYRYVMVDEYQDTNAIQADIVKGLAHSHHNIMVVGDDAQSIYSFRGANYRNMFDFVHLFPEAKVIKLEQNYRSTQPILDFTNALMEPAREKYTKCLFTRRSDGKAPRIIDTATEPEQAMFVCQFIKEHLSRGHSIRDFAVLFRAGYHSFELEVELARQGIPFVKYGGFKFVESAHIKDLLAHLRVIVNRDDTVAWGRILRLVKNIGQAKSQDIINWMKEERPQPWAFHDWPGARKGDAGLSRLSELIRKLSVQEVAPEKAVALAIEYYGPLLKERFDDFPRREKDLEQLVPMASRYRKMRPFLDDLILEPPNSLADMNQEDARNCLTLSTVHSAKGLEWPFVFVIWAMDGYFPAAKSTTNQEGIEEERRLMYVAATRAKDELLICYPGLEPPRAWAAQGGSGTPYRSGVSSLIQGLRGGVAEYGAAGTFTERTPVKLAPYTAPAVPPAGVRTDGLRPGDRVKHPAFGAGVVSKMVGKEKVEVLFRDYGRKMLHLGYTSLDKV